MQCKCGAEVKTSEHKVTTIRGFKEWANPELFDKSSTPYTVEQKVCGSCGRVASITVTDKNATTIS